MPIQFYNVALRTPKQEPQAPRHQAVVYSVLRSCSSVLSNGAQWVVENRAVGNVGDLCFYHGFLEPAAESFPGSPDSEASWQIIREPSLTAPGMPKKMSCGMETDFFLNE